PEPVFRRCGEELTRALTGLAREHGLTVATVLRGAWALVLARLAGRSDVVFGSTVAGRPADLPGVQSAIGLFINTLPVRVALTAGQPVIEMLAELQERQVRLMGHQYMGLAEINRLAGPGAEFDTLVVYENYPRPAEQPGGPGTLTMRPTGRPQDASHYPLALIANPGDRLEVQLDYRPDVYDRPTAEAIADRLMRVLEQLAADPSAPVARIDLLAPAERELLAG
ncbi:hypothetical protein ADK38_38880, partial [Streptomyces varsoviensis]